MQQCRWRHYRRSQQDRSDRDAHNTYKRKRREHWREATLHGCRSLSGARSQSERCAGRIVCSTVASRCIRKMAQFDLATQRRAKRVECLFGVVSIAIEPMVDESLYAASQRLEQRGNQQRRHHNHNGLRLRDAQERLYPDDTAK